MVHGSKVLELYLEQALLLESSRMGLTARKGRGATVLEGLKKDEALLIAADMHMKSGMVVDTCRLLAEIGLWTQAMALAPSVSQQFWAETLGKYAQVLAEQGGVAASMGIPGGGGGGGGGAGGDGGGELASGDITYHLVSGRVMYVEG